MFVNCDRMALMLAASFPTMELVPAGPAGSIIIERLVSGWNCLYCGYWVELVSATTPLNTADQAARSGRPFAPRLTDSCPRVALSFKAVLKLSNSSRSSIGALSAAWKTLPMSPVQIAHVLVP